jgi:predicted RNase H-like HicB family nuclease
MTMSPAEYLKMPYGRVVVPEEDGTFRGEIIEFPGCIAVGDTAAEALANLEDVAESWLEATLARGQHVPEPIENQGFSGKLVVRLPKTLHKKATYAAAREGVSLNQFIANSVAEQVGACSFRAAQYSSSSGTHVVRHGSFAPYVSIDFHGTSSGSFGASGPGFSRLPFDDNQMIDVSMQRSGRSHAGS